jgi:hypothetical protein
MGSLVARVDSGTQESYREDAMVFLVRANLVPTPVVDDAYTQEHLKSRGLQ